MHELSTPELAHNGMEGQMRKIVGLVGAALLFAGPALGADVGARAPGYNAPLWRLSSVGPDFMWAFMAVTAGQALRG